MLLLNNNLIPIPIEVRISTSFNNFSRYKTTSSIYINVYFL